VPDQGQPDDRSMSPSKVFARRLRALRKDRAVSQTKLAEMMTAAGVPMSRAALLRIEQSERTLSLDEALAFAYVLNAVPAQLLSPPEGEHTFVTQGVGFDGNEIRAWLRFGDPAAEVMQSRETLESPAYEITVHARALVDALRANDSAGRLEAQKAIVSAVLRAQRENTIGGLEDG
jgi:transcriptional regulator with XRE-family HTH domain